MFCEGVLPILRGKGVLAGQAASKTYESAAPSAWRGPAGQRAGR